MAAPVARIFGSYDCPPFRVQLGPLNKMYERWSGKVDFLVVYIKEAYPEDGWVVSMNRDENIVIEDPVTKEDRVDAAESCAINLAVKIPVLVDEMDDRIASAYGALPDRLYLINQDGQIEFQGEPGPWGFDPNQLEAAIEELFFRI